MQHYLTLWDFVLTPVYLLVLNGIAKKIRDKKYPKGHPLRPYFLPGLNLKFAGAIFIGLIYQYYYNGGDTYNFFHNSKIINSAFSDSFSTWFKLICSYSYDNSPEIYSYVTQMYWYNSPNNYIIGVIGAIFGIFTGTHYLPTALLFAFFSFTGVWALFRTFTNLYPGLHKVLAYAILFIPSVVVWGSAIFKDTVCLFALGWMVHSSFRLFVNRDLSVRNLAMMALSFYLVAMVKIYILLAFIPSLGLWLLMKYSEKVKNATLRWMINIAFTALVVTGFFKATEQFADELEQYSLENLASTTRTTQRWIQYASGDEGSAYNIGVVDGSTSSMLALVPKAIVVTLFRPFPWEVNKVIIALSALESLIILALTLKIVLDRRIRLLKVFGKDPNVLFCLVFALVFAAAVGISSGNFGTLSRYKIPCMPFYGIFLLVVINYEKHTSAATAYKPQLKRLRKRSVWA